MHYASSSNLSSIVGGDGHLNLKRQSSSLFLLRKNTTILLRFGLFKIFELSLHLLLIITYISNIQYKVNHTIYDMLAEP